VLEILGKVEEGIEASIPSSIPSLEICLCQIMFFLNLVLLKTLLILPYFTSSDFHY